MWLLYIVIWLEHHGDGTMGLLSKKWDGLDAYSLDCYDYQSTCGAKKNIAKGTLDPVYRSGYLLQLQNHNKIRF